MSTAIYTSRFKRELKAKKRRHQTDLASAVVDTVELVLTDRSNNGLNAHRVDGDIWEAYVNDAARITFQQDDDVYIFRNNCDHRMIDRRQW